MDVKAYTDTELKEQLGLIELHVKQYGVDKDFCLGCIQKHLDNISGLSKEGTSIKGHPETYHVLTKWVDEIRHGKFNSMDDVAIKARDFRRELGSEITTEQPRHINPKDYRADFYLKEYKRSKHA